MVVESELVYIGNAFAPGPPRGQARVQDGVLSKLHGFSLCTTGAWTIRELFKSITVFYQGCLTAAPILHVLGFEHEHHIRAPP